MHDYLLKFIIIGNSMVGKSNILSTFADNRFMQNHDMTIGVEFATKLMAVNGLKYKLQIWDTAGQETFRAITRSYYRGTVGCLIVYDITRRDSFESVQSWLDDLRKVCDPNIVIVLVGNKIDIETKRQITTDEGRELAEKNNLLFFETSAKTHHNIEEVFVSAVENISKKNVELGLKIQTSRSVDSDSESNVNLSNDSNSNPSKSNWSCSC